MTEEAANAVSSVAEQPDTTTQPSPNEGAAPEPAQESAQEQPDAQKPDNDPEKLAKALNRAKKKIDRLTAIKYEQDKELSKYRSSTASQTPDATPAPQPKPQKALKLDDFDSAEEYVEALAEQIAESKLEAKLDAKFKDFEGKTKAEREADAKARETAARNAAAQARFKTQAETVAQRIEDFYDVMKTAEGEPADHVLEAINDADNSALVAYFIAKEDLLDDLNAMSPSRAAMKIARIEDEAKGLLEPKVTKAPAPMQSNSGTAPTRRGYESMSGKEILEDMRKRNNRI